MNSSSKYSLAAKEARLFSGAKDHTIQRRQLSMTVIAAMWESDESILIGADSGRTQMFTSIRDFFIMSATDDKLQAHPSGLLAWGTSGCIALGGEFGEYLKGEAWLTSDWNSFRAEACLKLAELNRKQRDRIAVSGAEVQFYDTASALIVGWLNGKPNVLELDDRGLSSMIDKDFRFHAIGSGAPFAVIIDRAFAAIDLQKPPLEKLQIVLELAARMDPGCANPIHIWRVKQDGIEVIS